MTLLLHECDPAFGFGAGWDSTAPLLFDLTGLPRGPVEVTLAWYSEGHVRGNAVWSVEALPLRRAGWLRRLLRRQAPDTPMPDGLEWAHVLRAAGFANRFSTVEVPELPDGPCYVLVTRRAGCLDHQDDTLPGDAVVCGVSLSFGKRG